MVLSIHELSVNIAARGNKTVLHQHSTKSPLPRTIRSQSLARSDFHCCCKATLGYDSELMRAGRREGGGGGGGRGEGGTTN